MDFWTRLVANTPLSRTSRKDAARDPIKRRHRFEKEYGQLLQIWRNASNLSSDVDSAENLEIRLQELTSMLVDESRRPLPHPCVSFCAVKRIYIPIAKIATSSNNEWIIREAVLFFATLAESEEEAFLESDAFSGSLTNLLGRITGANSMRLGSDTEVRVVELAFNITTKIRLESHILPAWFKPHHDTDAQDDGFKDERERFAGRTQKEDFPLFYILMDYIHHEGKIGDFARTGLLYIMEAASTSVELEQWVVESDLSTLMATGLGALYSQLSRKLVVDHPPHKLPPVLALSDYQHPETTLEIVGSCDPDFQLHLETFLSHLLFWQDVLNHCRSTEIRSTLLEHFQVIFLQQLLYPSLLESSDIDGGSSVAVLTYLRRILESLDHPDMINLILHYLLALPDAGSLIPSGAEPSVSAARKRKSMDLASMMATKAEAEYTPLLFNLVDLIQSCLKSPNQQTVCVTLQLLAAILKRHHRYAIITLLHTESIHGSASQRTVGAHQQEIEFLMTMAESVGGQDDFDQVYDTILKDTMTRVEGHPCSLKLVAPKVSTNNHTLPAIPDSLPGAPQDVPPHTLKPHDPLLNNILDLLESFFINPVEINLSITETILDMAVCGYISIEGWLLRHPTTYQFEEDHDEPEPGPEPEPEPVPSPQDEVTAVPNELKKLEAVTRCRRRPKWQPSTLPRILSILESLADQLKFFRSSVPRFEELLQQRREAFQTADTVLPNPQTVRVSSKSRHPGTEGTSLDGSRSASPARPSALEGIAQRILSELSTPTRSTSPRGRKEASRGSASPSKPLPPIPKELDPPDQRRFSQQSSLAGQKDEFATGGRASPAMTQAAPHAAVDQEILSRRVGLPTQKVAPIPLHLKQDEVKDAGVEENAGNEDEEEAVGTRGSSREEEQPKEEPREEQSKLEEDQPEEEEPKKEQPRVEELNEEEQPQKTKPEEEGQQLKGEQQPKTEEYGQGQAKEEEGEAATLSDADAPSAEKTASVSHILTNAIIYQSFLLELASLVQVRAGLFNEVRFA
ncbi:hypothetical protein DL765_000522 [Monosporascus sp. GIB2]|nr:hypothetical protein DL765_000522 [Monosporascus sp. GIB2]